jgi:hypothetical protein
MRRNTKKPIVLFAARCGMDDKKGTDPLDIAHMRKAP